MLMPLCRRAHNYTFKLFSHIAFQFVLSINSKLLNFVEPDYFGILSTHTEVLCSTTAGLLFCLHLFVEYILKSQFLFDIIYQFHPFLY